MGTESLVAIELDSRRNELVALNLVYFVLLLASKMRHCCCSKKKTPLATLLSVSKQKWQQDSRQARAQVPTDGKRSRCRLGLSKQVCVAWFSCLSCLTRWMRMSQLAVQLRKTHYAVVLQIVVIITVMFAFVSMVAGIFGQNLHFGSVETGTVSFSSTCITTCNFSRNARQPLFAFPAYSV